MENQTTEQNNQKPITPIFLDKQKQARIVDLYQNQGLSYRKIAKIIGCHFFTVSKYVKKSGIKPRYSFDWHKRTQKKEKKEFSQKIRLNRIEKALNAALLELRELKKEKLDKC